ncbi:MAG: YraN family protein [Rhizobiaceae bacterium]|nr:YraN family protein [Rhizobiaceae bacterium]
MPSAKETRQKAQIRGRRSEWLAALSLRIKGYRVIERGFKTGLGEIDIIARKQNLIAIVEVKARKNISLALNAVGRESQNRIANAADIWLSRQKDFHKLSIRFDIIAIVPGKWPKHFPGAF